LCWSGLYFGIKYYLQLQEQTQQTLKATSAAHQAQKDGGNEAGDCGAKNDRKIGLGLLMSERAQPRSQRVAGPTRNIQYPEQAPPVPDEMVYVQTLIPTVRSANYSASWHRARTPHRT
jgi:hypothetical protein